MNNSVLDPRLDASQWEPKCPFDLVVAYEDNHTRNRALHIYDHFAQQLLDEYDFRCSWWKFDHLANSTLGEQAADAAVAANMVVLSLYTRSDLPHLHRQWLETWLPRRDGRKAALVTLIAGHQGLAGETEPMVAYLQRSARLARMDFFAHTFPSPLANGGLGLAARPIPQPSLPPAALLEEFLPEKMPTPRWGINEWSRPAAPITQSPPHWFTTLTPEEVRIE